MTPLQKIDYLSLPLPHDIEAAKQSGYLHIARQLIDRKLEDERFPDSMKIRLELEKEILTRIPSAYPYTLKQGLAMIQKEIPDYTMGELLEKVHQNEADWIYIDGNVHLLDRFYASMKKTDSELAERAGQNHSGSKLSDENIADMKKNGSSVWHIHLKTALKIKDASFEAGHKVLVHLPLPALSSNMKNIEILSHSDHALIDKETSLSRTIAFQETMTANHPFYVEYAYDSFTKYVNPVEGIPFQGSSPFLEEKEPHILFTPLIRHLADDLKGDRKNPVDIARAFYRFITEKVHYSYMPPYLLIPEIPDYCASSLKGDCGVQALLFITLCRYAGIPARWQSGKYITPDDVGNHDWAEFYIEPYGWMFADCSFGGGAYRNHNLERQNFYFGNLDPFRMAANNDFQQEFFVAKQHYRKDPYDNQSGEAEYDDTGLNAGDFECTTEVIDMHKKQ